MNLERMLTKFDVNPDTLCWEWNGARYRSGYASYGMPGYSAYVHRVMYEALVGPIPDGYQVDHLCFVKHCVNPDHLEPVSQAENIRRAKHRMRKEVCRNGHPRTPEGTYIDPKGKRACRICKQSKDRAYRKQIVASGKAKESAADWRERNREHLRAYFKEYRENHRDEIKQRTREWRQQKQAGDGLQA